jgi:nicotinamide phosphoribosyltransferase
MNIAPLLQTDFYKTSHYKMYPTGTTKIYSNLTPRKSRIKGVNAIVVFGIQYFILEYLIKQWNDSFFTYTKPIAIKKYKRIMDPTLGKDSISTEHLEKLWDLNYMPLHIKALPEGTLCPIGVPCMTITNTVDHAYWLVNYLETILSCTVWQPITSATIAYEFRKLLNKYAYETTGQTQSVQWQGHDFSMRGMSSLESACTSGAGHLLSFTGTDTIPAISFLEQYYGANVDKELVGASVPATEHSVMCMGSKDDEIGTFKRLLDLYPSGILSVVSDTWDLWKVLTEYLPALKDQILARDGKLVIRPDSGDPVDIICGRFMHHVDGKTLIPCDDSSADKGVIQLLWDTFGGTVNKQGYKELNSHIGAIYGDSISLERAEQICERLKSKGFASTNIVFGIGSYTYQMNTRDTFGFAVKATYGEVLECGHHVECCEGECKGGIPQGREIFKDPITDDGTKKSAKGLLQVVGYDYDGGEPSYGTKHPGFTLALRDQVSKEDEEKGYLETVFLDGKLTKHQTLSEIRERLLNQ